MCSQESLSHFLKKRRLPYTRTQEGSVEQTPRPAPRAYVALREIKLLWEAPEHRRGLGNKQFSIEELLSHGKKKPEHLPRLTSSVSEGHSPDPKGCLNIVSKRFQRGDSAEGQGHRRTFPGHLDLPKNSPKAVTAWEAQVNRRTMALLGKVRKQTEKTPEDARQFLQQEVVVNNKNPTKKCQQLKNLEDLRRDHLEGGGDIELRQPRGPYRYDKHVAPLDENIFLQGKKIKPHSRRPMQAVCPPSVREEKPGEKLKPEPSGQDTLEDMKASKEREAQAQFLQENTFLEGPSRVLGQNLLAEAKSQLLNRRKMQALEMAKSHDKEFWVFGTRRKIQLPFQDSKQGASRRNIVRHKWQPREEGWDPTIQGTPVILVARAHT
ncbi:protein Tex24-like [Chionomys nivalis]|uniref:protein Tex24-like n=1 Tax=Chionomys nivalis TaxID=269649 RepID=UPI002597624A|nr:protein Tex24-like [Chionomys nivalis]